MQLGKECCHSLRGELSDEAWALAVLNLRHPSEKYGTGRLDVAFWDSGTRSGPIFSPFPISTSPVMWRFSFSIER